MAKQKEVSYKVFNEKNEELRIITVMVEGGQNWQRRAEEEAVKQVAPGERVELVPAALKGEKEKTGTKFTFEFEIYHHGVQKRILEKSAFNESEDAALEAVIAELNKDLTDGESFRYTNKFRKEVIEEGN